MLIADIVINTIIITMTDSTIPAIAPADSPSDDPVFVIGLSVVLVLVALVSEVLPRVHSKEEESVLPLNNLNKHVLQSISAFHHILS